MLYHTYYCEFMSIFTEQRLKLLHSQTDSMANCVSGKSQSGENYYSQLARLSHILDSSKISPEIVELYSVVNKNKPLKLKIESLHVKSFISIRQHVYSYLTLSPEFCYEHILRFCVGCAREKKQGYTPTTGTERLPQTKLSSCMMVPYYFMMKAASI